MEHARADVRMNLSYRGWREEPIDSWHAMQYREHGAPAIWGASVSNEARVARLFASHCGIAALPRIAWNLRCSLIRVRLCGRALFRSSGSYGSNVAESSQDMNVHALRAPL